MAAGWEPFQGFFGSKRQRSCGFRTRSTRSRMHPRPPLNSETQSAAERTSATASAGQTPRPASSIAGMSGISSPTKATCAGSTPTLRQKWSRSSALSFESMYRCSSPIPSECARWTRLCETPPVMMAHGKPLSTAVRTAKQSFELNWRSRSPSGIASTSPSVKTPSMSNAKAFISSNRVMWQR